MMKMNGALAAILVLTACSGNPFLETPVTPPGPDGQVGVDPKVSLDLRAITYSPSNGGSLKVNLNGLVGSSQNVTFVRDASLDVDGYEAYRYTERPTNPTQRSYIALVANNPAATGRNNLRAMAVSDGGQFNRHFGGAMFARIDAYSAPIVSETVGQFSYAGTYAGIFSPGTITSDLPAGLVPYRPYRTQGDALMTANFANNLVEGGVANRWLLDANGNHVDLNGDGTVDNDDMLPDITFPHMEITASGQFIGNVELTNIPPTGPNPPIGTVNGLFGGVGATDIAGALVISPLGIPGIWEHGVFNLPRCGTTGEDAVLCNPNPLP